MQPSLPGVLATSGVRQQRGQAMSESARRITNALLRVASDIGHGGSIAEYRIDSHGDVYTATLKISRPHPAPGESRFRPSEMTEVLAKDNQQAAEFLRKLSAEFNVYELADLKSPYPFLHPTFYSFSFRDSSGGGHSFDYQIECSNHLDGKYRELVQEFDNFFESRRVFDKFYESGRRYK